MKAGQKQGEDIRLSALEESLLALLIGKELYGLSIINAMQEVTGRLLGPSSLYPTLRKMEDRGLVRSWWGDERPEERGHARRRYYTATGLGADTLETTEQRRLQQHAKLVGWRPALGEI